MKKYLLILSILLVVAGCSREPRPEGFPKLYPCAIRITQDGAPMAGVKVSLVHPELTARWAVGAESDASGVATLRTHGFVGVPQGRYKIVLSKTETEGRGQLGDEHKDRGWEDIKIYSLVDEKYENAGETPLEIEVGEKAVDQTFEIEKPERRLVQVIREGMS